MWISWTVTEHSFKLFFQMSSEISQMKMNEHIFKWTKKFFSCHRRNENLPRLFASSCTHARSHMHALFGKRRVTGIVSRTGMIYFNIHFVELLWIKLYVFHLTGPVTQRWSLSFKFLLSNHFPSPSRNFSP